MAGLISDPDDRDWEADSVPAAAGEGAAAAGAGGPNSQPHQTARHCLQCGPHQEGNLLVTDVCFQFHELYILYIYILLLQSLNATDVVYYTK